MGRHWSTLVSEHSACLIQYLTQKGQFSGLTQMRQVKQLSPLIVFGAHVLGKRELTV